MDPTIQEPDPIPTTRAHYLWIEVGVVLLFYLAPYVFYSEANMHALRGTWPTSTFLYHALDSLITNAGQIALVLFIIWRSGDPFTRFGLRPFHIPRDLLGGILIWFILRIAYHLTWLAVRIIIGHANYVSLLHTGNSSSYLPPSGFHEFVLLGLMCLSSGFTQELIMRAYLITRFEELLDSTPIALFLSTVLFIIYHGYQGVAAIIGIAVFGLLQGLIFCLTRRLAPVSIAHAITNFFAIGRLKFF